MSLLRDELAITKERLEKVSLELDKTTQELKRPININVNQPKKLKTFDGKVDEVEKWLEDARALLVENNDPKFFIKSSLRGVALDAAADCKTNEEVLIRIRQTFSEILDIEEELVKFSMSQPEKKEKASDYLLRLYERMNKINRVSDQAMRASEVMNKVYKVFTQSKNSYPLIILAVRSTFGMPGEKVVEFPKLLTFVKKEEEGSEPPLNKASASNCLIAEPTLSEEDFVDKIANKVFEKLNQKNSNQSKLTPESETVCYGCGQSGHIRRFCRNQGNEQRSVGGAHQQAQRGRGRGRRGSFLRR